MDIIIISTNSPHQETFWKYRLETAKTKFLNPKTLILTVLEDWPAGAGNGLGSLYAYQKASEKAKKLHQTDINKKLEEGASIALYHTAGQGKRLCPLATSEYNNKSAVKLPGYISPDTPHLMTILEAVIKQTSSYTPNHSGRFFVFWGDQIFMPSSSQGTPKHHIDILTKFIPHPTQKEWEEQELEKYGFILLDGDGKARHIDKCSYHTFKQLLKNDQQHLLQEKVGISLGSFSLSASLTLALLREFQNELKEKNTKMDSDPHFWMPLTLDRVTYTEIMTEKGVDPSTSKKHHDRMCVFFDTFETSHPELTLFGTLDIGENGLWWDYGTIQSYYQNIIKLTASHHEADVMRQFLLPSISLNENHSCLINCQIKEGNIKNSVLIGVTADSVEVEDAVILNTTAKKIEGRKCLAYNVLESNLLSLGESHIRADAFLPETGQHLKFYSDQTRDGKLDWDIPIPHNPCSYAEMASLTSDIDLIKAEVFKPQG